MRIQHNIAALNSYRNLTNNNNAVAKNLEKLSSGYRINRAGDDAAGLAISEKMRAQITGLNTAQKNAQDGISLVQTAEGALTEVHSMLNRMVELANQSANGTYADAPDRKNLQAEINSLMDEIDRISDATNFNGINLLDGTLGLNSSTFEIGKTPIAANTDGPKEITGVNALHTSASSGSPQGPKFNISFADLNIALKNTSTTASATGNIGITIGGKTVSFAKGASTASLATSAVKSTVTVASAGKATATGGVTTPATASVAGAGIATAIRNAGYSHAVIDGSVFSIASDGADGLTFEYVGKYNDTNGYEADDGKGSTVSDSTFEVKGKVEVTVGGKLGTAANTDVITSTGRDNCHLTTIKDTVVGEPPKRAGAKFTLTADMIKSGALKIGNETFTFDYKTAPPAAGDTSNVIKLKDVDDADLVQEVTRQLSYKTTTITKDGTDYTFQIGRGNEFGEIEIEEAVQSDPDDYGNFSADELKAAGLYTYGTTSTTNAASTVELKQNAKIGDSIQINGKTYTFGGDKGIAIGATAADSAKNLAAEVAKDTGVTVEVNGAKLTVHTATVGGDAPQIGSAGLTLQIGDTSDPYNRMTVGVRSMSAASLGIEDIDISTQGGAQAAVDKIKAAIDDVSSQRGDLGAIQNRLEHTINNLSVTAENMTAAESRIRDVDMANEMMAYTKNNILVQAAQAMLAQANQVPQGVLQLLQ